MSSASATQSPSPGQRGIVNSIDQVEDHCSEDFFAAEDDAFLDSVSEMLQRLTEECEKALEWSSESEATVENASEAFKSIASMCRHAGLEVVNVEELNAIEASNDALPLIPAAPDTNLSIEVPSPSFSGSGLSRRGPISTGSCANANSRAWSSQVGSLCDPVDSAKERDNDSRFAMNPVRREEIIEIELTDLLTHTHEEIQHCRNQLIDQLHQADTRHSEAHVQTQTDMDMLQRALESSQTEMTRIQQEVRDTKQNMAALQTSVLESQRSMEAAMKDQTRQWKAICNDLIVEKRNVAKKLAEERGKCASLKEHLAMHDNQDHTRERRSSPQSRRDVYASPISPSHKKTVPEIELESPKASSLCPASPLAALSSMDHDFELLHSDLYSEGRDGSIGSPGFRSASSVGDSGRGGNCKSASIHSPKRKLTSSDLSTSHTSNSRHRSHSVASSSRSGVSSGVKMLQLKLEPHSERSSTPTASFRRYYLSSKQQLSTSNNSNSSSSRIAPLT